MLIFNVVPKVNESFECAPLIFCFLNLFCSLISVPLAPLVPVACRRRFLLGVRDLLGMPMNCVRCLRPDSIVYDVFACVSVRVLYGLYPSLCCSQGRPKPLIPLHDLRLAVCPPRVHIMLCWHSCILELRTQRC